MVRFVYLSSYVILYSRGFAVGFLFGLGIFASIFFEVCDDCCGRVLVCGIVDLLRGRVLVLVGMGVGVL